MLLALASLFVATFVVELAARFAGWKETSAHLDRATIFVGAAILAHIARHAPMAELGLDDAVLAFITIVMVLLLMGWALAVISAVMSFFEGRDQQP